MPGSSGTTSQGHQVHGIGAQIGYAIPTWRRAVTAKYLYEYYAETRFRGQAATLSIAYQL